MLYDCTLMEKKKILKIIKNSVVQTNLKNTDGFMS